MSHRSRSISARSFELCAAGPPLVDDQISGSSPTSVRLMTSARPIRSGGCFYINCIRRIAVIRRHGYPAPPRGIRGGALQPATGYVTRFMPTCHRPLCQQHIGTTVAGSLSIGKYRISASGKRKKKTTDLKVCRSIIALLHPFSAPCGEWGIRTPGTVTRTAV